MLLVVDCSPNSFYQVFWNHQGYEKPLRKMRKNRMRKGTEVFEVLKRK